MYSALRSNSTSKVVCGRMMFDGDSDLVLKQDEVTDRCRRRPTTRGQDRASRCDTTNSTKMQRQVLRLRDDLRIRKLGGYQKWDNKGWPGRDDQTAKQPEVGLPLPLLLLLSPLPLPVWAVMDTGGPLNCSPDLTPPETVFAGRSRRLQSFSFWEWRIGDAV